MVKGERRRPQPATWQDCGRVRVLRNRDQFEQVLQAVAAAPVLHLPQHLPFEQEEQWAELHLEASALQEVQALFGQVQFARNSMLAPRARELRIRVMTERVLVEWRGGWPAA